MGKSPVKAIRMPHETYRRLKVFAAAHDLTVGAAVTALLDQCAVPKYEARGGDSTKEPQAEAPAVVTDSYEEERQRRERERVII